MSLSSPSSSQSYSNYTSIEIPMLISWISHPRILLSEQLSLKNKQNHFHFCFDFLVLNLYSNIFCINTKSIFTSFFASDWCQTLCFICGFDYAVDSKKHINLLIQWKILCKQFIFSMRPEISCILHAAYLYNSIRKY